MENENRSYPQKDLPYEVQMKYIIHGYRKLQEQLDYIVPYTKKLEKTIENLEEKISLQRYKNKNLYEKYVENNREKKRWKAHSEWLTERMDEMERILIENNKLLPPDDK